MRLIRQQWLYIIGFTCLQQIHRGEILSIPFYFPGGTVVKNPPASAGDARDPGSIPGLGRSPGVGNGNPFQYSCLENSLGRGAWRAAVQELAESDIHTSFCFRPSFRQSASPVLFFTVAPPFLLHHYTGSVSFEVSPGYGDFLITFSTLSSSRLYILFPLPCTHQWKIKEIWTLQNTSWKGLDSWGPLFSNF